MSSWNSSQSVGYSGLSESGFSFPKKPSSGKNRPTHISLLFQYWCFPYLLSTCCSPIVFTDLSLSTLWGENHCYKSPFFHGISLCVIPCVFYQSLYFNKKPGEGGGIFWASVTRCHVRHFKNSYLFIFYHNPLRRVLWLTRAPVSRVFFQCNPPCFLDVRRWHPPLNTVLGRSAGPYLYLLYNILLFFFGQIQSRWYIFFCSEMNRPQLFCLPSPWKISQWWVGRNTFRALLRQVHTLDWTYLVCTPVSVGWF